MHWFISVSSDKHSFLMLSGSLCYWAWWH